LENTLTEVWVKNELNLFLKIYTNHNFKICSEKKYSK
jgi:hypothetical protein